MPVYFKDRSRANANQARDDQFNKTLDQIRSKPIDRSGALTAARRSDISERFKAQDFDRSQLFKQKGGQSANRSFNFWSNKGGYRGGGGGSEPPEKLLCIEMVGDELMGITFQGFFSVEIKDAVKSVTGANYDQQSKSWQIRKSEREALIDAVGALCIQHDVKISDIPKFILDF